MVKLKKGNEPDVLSANKTDWTNQLLSLIGADQPIPTSLYKKYSHDEVKDALRSECNSKCMYCESKVEHITDLHIEHIKPKAKDQYPELTYQYDNLGLACPLCNRNKRDIYDPDVPFINPYIDEPDDHFNAYGAFVWAKSGDERAKLTELQIDLNRSELIEARGERLKTIRALVDDYHNQRNPTIKAAIKKEILKEVDKDKIYSFCCSVFVTTAI